MAPHFVTGGRAGTKVRRHAGTKGKLGAGRDRGYAHEARASLE